MRKPRLLVLTSTFPRWPGDKEPAFVYQLSRRLTSRFVVTVLAPRAPASAQREDMEGVVVRRYPYFFRPWERLATHGGGILARLHSNRLYYLLVPLFLLGQLWALMRLLRQQQFDVIQAHWLIPQGLIATLARALTGRPVPLVCTSHGADLFALRGALMRRLKRTILNESDMVTVVSSAMRNECLALGSAADRIKVIPMGVDLQRQFTPDPQGQRHEHEILFVGRLVKKKGVALLLQAMPQILRQQPQARLSIAGGGPLEAELRGLVGVLGIREQVTFLGMVGQSELPNLYRRAALFVAPFVVTDSGDQEGLGLVLVEAAGCGCPIVCGDVPAVTDVIQDGDTGLIVAPDDPSALAAVITGLLADPERRRRLADNAGRHCRLAFDWESVAERYARLLLGVATNRQ
ncbi:glycosyltransferase family 4 protein [uncultured Thiodictyon sp.]|uniref:glycosyltransferase family 4 protein n=1 Tax=uncultured Thiodictyon sp. TaxID=1846217 RepID=UPI0025E1AC0D|nr:glycosyltransferase family 4 protein [uncultured Thiodictyon sp.]